MVQLSRRPGFGQLLEAINEWGALRLDLQGRVKSWNRAAPRMLGCSADDLRGRDCSFLFVEGGTDASQALRHAVSGGRYGYEGWLSRDDGAQFWAAVTIVSVIGRGGSTTEYAVAVRDLTKSKGREAGLQAALDVVQAVLAGMDLDAVLQLVAERARVLVRADAAAVRTADAGQRALVLRGVSERRGSSHVMPLIPVRALPIPGSICGAVFETGRPRLFSDLWGAWRSLPAAAAGSRLTSALGRVMHGPALLVPLRVRDRTLGVLMASNTRRRLPFHKHDLATLGLFANQVAVTVQQAHVRRDHERRGLVEERKRLGRDLHDGAIQSLYAVTLRLMAAIERAQDRRLVDQLVSLTAGVDVVIGDLRGHVSALRSDAGDPARATE
jgi:PAS domain S-box-containing protein